MAQLPTVSMNSPLSPSPANASAEVPLESAFAHALGIDKLGDGERDS